jgi:NADH-quinone oxidoreductase subunit E
MPQLLEKYPTEIEKILSRYPADRKRSAVLPLLYLAQQEYGYCTPDAIREVAGIAEVEPTEVDAVVGFYTLFFDHPVGKHVVQVCNDLPCALRGSDQFLDHACQKLGVDRQQAEHGGATTTDGQFTLESVVCLAACDKAPMMQIDLEYFERLTRKSLTSYREDAGKVIEIGDWRNSSAPFRLLWNLLAGILNLTGRVVALILGVALLIVGVLLSATGILACLGVPLAIFGLLLIIRGLF